jgi:hypothetical protein
MTVAIAHAAPTAPAPIIPIFMIGPRLCPGQPGDDSLAAASNLMLLVATAILNDRQRVTGRKGVPESFVEPLIGEFWPAADSTDTYTSFPALRFSIKQ